MRAASRGAGAGDEASRGAASAGCREGAESAGGALCGASVLQKNKMSPICEVEHGSADAAAAWGELCTSAAAGGEKENSAAAAAGVAAAASAKLGGSSLSPLFFSPAMSLNACGASSSAPGCVDGRGSYSAACAARIASLAANSSGLMTSGELVIGGSLRRNSASFEKSRGGRERGGSASPDEASDPSSYRKLMCTRFG